jgi:hypothetical protein
MLGSVLKAVGGAVKAGAKIGQGIAQYIDNGDKQNEARRLEEMRRRYQQRILDRGYAKDDARGARYGDDIMQQRSLSEENKRIAEQNRNYQRGERTIGDVLSVINNNPEMRARTLSIFNRS